MATPTSWNDIPDVALIDIYRQLNDQDRLNMACTCVNWNRLFPTSKLWRERRVMFRDVSPERYVVKESNFISKFGHCLFKLTLRFGAPTFRTCTAISRAAEAYLNFFCNRNDIHLEEIDVEHMHMENHWHFVLSRNRLVTSLCRMLRKQKFLKTIYASGGRMRLHDGCRLLEAIAKPPAGCTITKLFMEDFFETNMYPCTNRRYVTAMSRFLALNHLHLNYKYLNQEILRNMSNRLSHSLKTLSFIIEGDIRGLEIPAAAWHEFKERCPSVQVSVFLCTTTLRGRDLTTAFVREMPLYSCYLTSWMRLDETENRLGVLLRHLANLYASSLEKFMMFFERHEGVDADVLYCVGKCTRMKDMCLQCSLSVDTVTDIMKLQHDGRIALTALNLTISGLSDEDWQRIDTAKASLIPSNTIKFLHVGPTDPDHDPHGDDTEPADDDDDEDPFGNILIQMHDAEFGAIEISDDEDDLYNMVERGGEGDEEAFLF